MADILIRTVDNTNPTLPAERQQAGLYKRGDGINVFPDDTDLATLLARGGFATICIPGEPEEDYYPLLEPELGPGMSVIVEDVPDDDVENANQYIGIDQADIYEQRVLSSSRGFSAPSSTSGTSASASSRVTAGGSSAAMVKRA